MKATITATLAAGTLCVGILTMLGGEAQAQVRPEAVRPEAGAPGPEERSPRAPLPRRPDAASPNEDAPAMDEMPVMPGACPDQRRKLQLIV